MATSKEKSQANRAATITGNSAGSVLEDGASIASGLLVVSDLDKGENQVKAIKEKSGEYGKFSISADGSWTYVLNKNSKDVQELAEGETVTEKFVVTSKDGSASKTVVVTVTGTNDVARIKGDTRATLTEDSHHTTARGELEVKDLDHGQSSVQVVTNQAGTYGAFSINAKGHWTYVMDNSLAATQALAQGEKGTDSFVVWSKDGSASQTVTVTLKGVNDEATITGQDTGSVSEDAAPNTATGQLIVNDVDNGENTVVPITAQAGAYGSFSIAADGSWTYTLDNSLLAVQSLPAGVTLTESFVVWSNDSQLFLNEHDDDEDHDDEDHDSDDDHDRDGGHDDGEHEEDSHDDDHHAPSYKGASKVVTVTIVGTNDAAVITGSSTGAVTEDLSLGVSGQLNVVDIDTGESSFQAQSNTVGTYGSLSLGTDGAWSYALNNGADNVQALAAGEAATDTFVVKSYDGTEQQITLTLTGTNDLATISGSSIGAVTEDAALVTGAALVVSDVDRGEAVFQAQAGVAATYGSFDIGTDGNWTYALNNTAANVQALAAGEQVTDTFTATSFDGTASQLVAVTITGSNDGPVVTNSAAAAVGAVAEDSTLSATGQLSASDLDNGATQSWSIQGSANGAYGAIGIDAATGQWTYNLNNSVANVQALAAGQSQTETFAVRVTDDQGATADQQVSVTVVGSNDGPVVTNTTEATAGAVAEDGTLFVMGQLSASDVDTGATQSWSVLGSANGIYGAIGIDAASGQWTYNLNNGAANVQALAAGESHVETFIARVTDDQGAFVDQQVNVTVTGSNDGPLIAAQTSAVETLNFESGFYSDGSYLHVSDGYGGFNWSTSHTTYNGVAADILAGGNVSAVSGYSAAWNGYASKFSYITLQDTGTFNFEGANFRAFSNTVNQIKLNGYNNGVLQGSELVNLASPWQSVSSSLNGIDQLVIEVTSGTQSGNGVSNTGWWGMDDFKYSLNSGTQCAAVREDATLSATGQLTATDVDNGATQTWSVQSAANGAYGAIGIDATSGQWTYNLNNSAAHVQALAAGETHTETFTLRVTDDQGATADQSVSVVVTGANDGPTGSATAALAAGTEDSAYTISASSLLAGFSDVDNGDVLSVSSLTASNGSLVNNGNGTYTITPSANFNGAVTLNYNVVDGKGGSVAATQNYSVTAVNDAPTGVATTVLATGTEDTAYTVSAADLLAGFGDVDTGDTLSVSGLTVSNGALANNGNGTYTITPTANFNGAVTLNYNVVDGNGGSVAATQSYNLAAVNDAPALQGTQTEQLYTSSLSVWTPFLVNNGVWVTPTGASSGDTAPHTFVRQFTAAQDGNYMFQFAVDNEGSVLVDGVAIAGLYNNDWSHSTVQTVALTAGIHTVTMNAKNWGGPAAFAMNIMDPNNQEIWNTRTHLDPEPLILSYTENQSAIVVSSGLTLSDIDSPTFTQATVAVGTGFVAGDVLGFADQNGITGVYDSATGVLGLSGLATQAQYQAALRSVTYSNSSDSPSTADRTINFTVDDGADQSNLSNTVQSKIIVMAVNDAATISGTSTGVVTEDTTLTTGGTLTVSDVDEGEAIFVAQSAVAGTYGSFSMDAAGQWTYVLNNSAANVQALDSGTTVNDSFTVWSQDGTASQVVSVGVSGTSEAPVAVNDNVSASEDGVTAISYAALLANDSGLGVNLSAINTTGTRGSLVNTGSGLSYTPGAAFQYLNAGQTALDSFSYTIRDANGLTSSASVTAVVSGQNDAPTAVDDSAFTNANTAVTIAVLANDSDPELDAISVGSVGVAAHGTVVKNADGTLNYTPTAGYAGTDSFSYTVQDASGATDTGVVSLVVGYADHDKVGNDVFLQGNYMEIGVSSAGSLGTASASPNNYHPMVPGGSRNISYVVDADGWNTGAAPTAGDFTLPGSPVDTIVLGFNGVSYAQDERSGVKSINTTTNDVSHGTTLAAQTVGTVNGVKLTQLIELGAGATYYKTTVTVQNTTAAAVSDVRFLRSFDPDQDVYRYGTYNTFNDVLSNPSTGNDLAVSRATGVVSGVSVNLVAFDSNARASNYGFANRNAYESSAFSAPVDLNGASVDQAITLEMMFGNIAAGASVTKEYFTSLNGKSTADDMTIGTTGVDILASGLGNDMLLGLTGNDQLTGGGGSDVFVFTKGCGLDIITDFTAGAATDDVVSLRGFGLTNLIDVRAHSTQVGADLLISLGGTDSLKLMGVSLANLHADDFTFA